MNKVKQVSNFTSMIENTRKVRPKIL